MELKKAFQLTKDYEDLMLATSKIKVAHTLLETAKFDLAFSAMERDRELARILKDDFGYLFSIKDIVTYNYQTNEIFIYVKNDETKDYEEKFDSI